MFSMYLFTSNFDRFYFKLLYSVFLEECKFFVKEKKDGRIHYQRHKNLF